MRLLFAILFLICSTASFAQKDTGHVGNVKVYPGKEFSQHEISAICKQHDSINNSYVGEPYVPFFLNTNTGENINNESITGKVLFIAFFFETCHCWDYKKLEAFYNSIKDEPGIQFVAVTNEGDIVQDFIDQEHISFPIARV